MRRNDEPTIIGQDAAEEVITFPQSVQDRLDEARALIAQDRTGEAAAALRSAGSELAQTRPELLAILMAAQLGHTKIIDETEDTDTVTVTTGRYTLGIRHGKDETVTTNRKAGKRTIKLE